MCIQSWALETEGPIREGTQLSKCFSTLEKLAAWPGQRHMQRRNLRLTYSMSQASGKHQGDEPKTSPQRRRRPTGGITSQGKPFSPNLPQGQCKAGVTFKKTQSLAVRSRCKEISTLTWHFLRNTLHFPLSLLPTTVPESLPLPLLPTQPSPLAVYFVNQLPLFPPYASPRFPFLRTKHLHHLGTVRNANARTRDGSAESETLRWGPMTRMSQAAQRIQRTLEPRLYIKGEPSS